VRNCWGFLVFNGSMKRSLFALAAAVLTAGLTPAWASAQTIEIGATGTPLVAPTCPKGVSASACTIVLPEVTALATLRDGVSYPTIVKRAGELAAFTVGVSALSSDKATVKSDVSYLDSAYGGSPEAQITVLRQVGSRAHLKWRVAAQGPPDPLIRYLGQVVTFPLSQPLPVVPGEAIALTVPTWAPVLSFDLTASKFAYRQSREVNCSKVGSAMFAQLVIGTGARYGCNYPGTRVEYTATEIPSPSPNAG
jgi:hypothetical protein